MRNVRGSQNSNFNHESIPLVPTVTTGPSVPASSATTFAAMPGRAVGGGQTDGVFANLSAKPTVAEKLEEHPPVSLEKVVWNLVFILTSFCNSHTSKQRPMQHPRIGKLRSLPLACPQTRFSLMVYQLVPFLLLFGMQ